MAASDVIVIGAGILLAGFLWWFFFVPKQARRAEVVGGMQEIAVTVRGGYTPNLIRVHQGVPLRLVFDRQESGDCTSRVVFADFGASKTLPAFVYNGVGIPIAAGILYPLISVQLSPMIAAGAPA